MQWASFALATLFAGKSLVTAQTWCGKNYMRNQTIVPPGGRFPKPGESSSPLLTFRCSQTIRPYLPHDTTNSPTVLVSSWISNTSYPDSVEWTPPPGFPGPFESRKPHCVASGSIPEIPTGSDPDQGRNQVVKDYYELPLDLGKLQPQKEHYTLEFRCPTFLSFPGNEIGSVTKMDGRSGALLVQSNEGPGRFKEIFPIGFYTQFNNYLTNLTVLSDLKNQGSDRVLDEMEKLGLYLMYDMRWTVNSEVNSIKKRPNLLLWYTADEPDGTSDPLDVTTKSYNLINSLDGGDNSGGSGYHPVSLVLNCQDYQFTPYASGADIIMTDVYPIGNNVTFSEPWGTECTPDYGDCGCDNCKGSLRDISDRLEDYRERLYANGWHYTKALWSVPQGFGNQSYWKRHPTGKEFIAQSVLAINYGAKGLISWTDPTTASIKSAAANLTKGLESMTPYLLSHSHDSAQVSAAVWTTTSGSLLTAVNLGPDRLSIKLDLTYPFILAPNKDQAMFSAVDQVLGEGRGANAFVSQEDGGQKYFVSATYELDGFESGAWIYTGLLAGEDGGGENNSVSLKTARLLETVLCGAIVLVLLNAM
ncbi:hypothetical protein FA13DRAFT_1730171 [Coprinellus micaceus]|uniref:Glycoside hydrolase n=1 Tax=Coprinellus micaceus TaxID=71717 RepID=A0A4Y7TI86_COPMI|nr:hypothetical protein FA13DRAFT_1730171 [Coprinellus micaceus]